MKTAWNGGRERGKREMGGDLVILKGRSNVSVRERYPPLLIFLLEREIRRGFTEEGRKELEERER